MPSAWIVVPCFNEAARLQPSEFWLFASREPQVRFLFVNDGSTDGTGDLLRRMASLEPTRFEVLDLPVNRGKAEAVRLGMCRALDAGAAYVGYWDADLATPLSEIPRFISHLEQTPALQLVLGARVQLLGRLVERSPVRHYVGRIFATLASLALGLPVYDTQCGAKLFRGTPGARAVLDQPFSSRWAFDVEILARWIASSGARPREAAERQIREIPLRIWHDVPGSKVGPRDFFRSVAELVRIHRRYVRGAPRSAARPDAEPRGTGRYRNPALAARSPRRS